MSTKTPTTSEVKASTRGRGRPPKATAKSPSASSSKKLTKKSATTLEEKTNSPLLEKSTSVAEASSAISDDVQAVKAEAPVKRRPGRPPKKAILTPSTPVTVDDSSEEMNANSLKASTKKSSVAKTTEKTEVETEGRGRKVSAKDKELSQANEQTSAKTKKSVKEEAGSTKKGSVATSTPESNKTNPKTTKATAPENPSSSTELPTADSALVESNTKERRGRKKASLVSQEEVQQGSSLSFSVASALNDEDKSVTKTNTTGSAKKASKDALPLDAEETKTTNKTRKTTTKSSGDEEKRPVGRPRKVQVESEFTLPPRRRGRPSKKELELRRELERQRLEAEQEAKARQEAEARVQEAISTESEDELAKLLRMGAEEEKALAKARADATIEEGKTAPKKRGRKPKKAETASEETSSISDEEKLAAKKAAIRAARLASLTNQPSEEDLDDDDLTAMFGGEIVEEVETKEEKEEASKKRGRKKASETAEAPKKRGRKKLEEEEEEDDLLEEEEQEDDLLEEEEQEEDFDEDYDDSSLLDDDDELDLDDLDFDSKPKEIDKSPVVPLFQKEVIAYKSAAPLYELFEEPDTDPEISRDFLANFGMKPYMPAEDEEYMSRGQLDHIMRILSCQKKEIQNNLREAQLSIQEDNENFADDLDKASREQEIAFNLRYRERENKLKKKIDATMLRLASDPDEFGYCKECDEEIGLRRLECRPTTDLCINCKNREEVLEAQRGGKR